MQKLLLHSLLHLLLLKLVTQESILKLTELILLGMLLILARLILVAHFLLLMAELELLQHQEQELL